MPVGHSPPQENLLLQNHKKNTNSKTINDLSSASGNEQDIESRSSLSPAKNNKANPLMAHAQLIPLSWSSQCATPNITPTTNNTYLFNPTTTSSTISTLSPINTLSNTYTSVTSFAPTTTTSTTSYSTITTLAATTTTTTTSTISSLMPISTYVPCHVKTHLN